MKKSIRRKIMAILSITSVFFLFAILGSMEQEKISISSGIYGTIGCLLWFICTTFLAGGFRKYVGRDN